MSLLARGHITTPKTVCIQIAMHDKLKQYTFCKEGFNMIKVYDLPSMKNWEASVDAAGSKNSFEKPGSTRSRRTQISKTNFNKKIKRTHQERAKEGLQNR